MAPILIEPVGIETNTNKKKWCRFFLIFKTMNFRTHYNYKSSTPRIIDNDDFVEYVDCSVDTALKNVENTTLQTTKPLYVDSKTPIKIFDSDILSTPYDPILQKKVASTRAQESQAAAAAAAPSVENNVNTNVQTE